MKKMRLRYDGTCCVCALALPATTQAWWDSVSKQVTCLGCHALAPGGSAPAPTVATAPAIPAPTLRVPEASEAFARTLPADLDAAALGALDRGVAGASARGEGVRRSKKREERIRAKHPWVGGLVLAVTDDPTTTKNWDRGGGGEERVGRRLDAARAKGIEVLHDRRIPGSRANIDHLAITPSGVWVVDAKRYLGKIERRDVGGLFKTDFRLFVKGRNQTKLIEGVRRQTAQVRDALVGTDFAAVPIHGALCFVDPEVGLFTKPFRIQGVAVTWRSKLVEPMLRPKLLGQPAIARLTLLLAERFKAA